MILLLTFFVVHGKSPEYLSELLVLHKPSRALRSANQPFFTQPHILTENVKVITSRTFIPCKVNMSEKFRWYSLKNVGNSSNGWIKYKLSALLYISFLTEVKYLYPR